MAAEGAPAAIVCGAVANASTGCVQTRNDFHASLKCAPVRSPTHHRFWPGGPQAALPGSLESPVCAESRTAALSRSRIAPLCAAKSAAESPVAFLGAHAKPQ